MSKIAWETFGDGSKTYLKCSLSGKNDR